jgi:hypothetical protein
MDLFNIDMQLASNDEERDRIRKEMKDIVEQRKSRFLDKETEGKARTTAATATQAQIAAINSMQGDSTD